MDIKALTAISAFLAGLSYGAILTMEDEGEKGFYPLYWRVAFIVFCTYTILYTFY